MNDLQVIIQAATVLIASGNAKYSKVEDAVSKAEEILEHVVERDHRHAMKHIGGIINSANLDANKKTCYHCRLMLMAMERAEMQKRKIAVPQA